MDDYSKSLLLQELLDQRIEFIWTHFVQRTPETLDAIKFHDRKIKELQNG